MEATLSQMDGVLIGVYVRAVDQDQRDVDGVDASMKEWGRLEKQSEQILNEENEKKEQRDHSHRKGESRT